jgi:hypothetical protein
MLGQLLGALNVVLFLSARLYLATAVRVGGA